MSLLDRLRVFLRAFFGFPASVPPVTPPVVPPVSTPPSPVIAPMPVPPVIAPMPTTPVIVPSPTPAPVVVVPKPAPPPPVAPKPVPVPAPPPPRVVPPTVASGGFGRGSFGLMHTHDKAHSVSGQTLNQTARVQATHIVGFGAGDPWPNENGDFDWGAIDWAIDRVKGAAVPVIVLCSAPGWMKGTPTFGRTQSGENAMDARVLRSKFPQFVRLTVAVVLRYRWCKKFCVWNEFKGFWDGGKNRWNYEEYIELYNMIWDAVKAVRPDVELGGPYMVLDTYASDNQSNPSSTWRGAWGVGDQRVQDAYESFFKNARGYDWIAFDFGVNHRGAGANFSDQRCLDKMLDFMRWLRTKTDKPIGCMETYLDLGPAYSVKVGQTLWVALLKRMRDEIPGESFALIWDEAGFRPAFDVGLLTSLQSVRSDS